MNWKIAPEQASNFALPHDLIFYTITILTILFTVIVGVMVVVFINKYRRGKVADRSNPVHDDHRLEAMFLGIPTLLGLAIFGWSTKVYLDMRTPPKDAYEVFVIGKQWMWHLQHPNGIRENNELHLPLNRPVKLTMISQDVIHAFYLPQMRVQYHVVPGRYTSLWFTPTKVGRFNIFCTIHCGTQHSEMGGYAYVLNEKEFQDWSASGGNRFRPKPKTVVAQGKQLFEDLHCNDCHGDKDTQKGPSLNGIFNTLRNLDNGQRVVADERHIRQSIIEPYGSLTKGYGVSMPVYEYKTQVSEEQLLALVQYVRSLSGARQGAPDMGQANPQGGQ